MKALQAISYSGLRALRISTDVELPVRGKASEVLVRVCAVGLNAFDWHRMHGYGARLLGAVASASGASALRLPITLGREGAGVVVEAADGSAGGSRFKPGDRVMWSLPVLADGCASEYAAFDDSLLVPVPPAWSFAQAAALPYAGLTALAAVRELGRVQPGDGVLVHGVSGSVGLLAAQLARVAGASVVAGTCSGVALSAVEAALASSDSTLGAGAEPLLARAVLDYSRQDRWHALGELVQPRSRRWVAVDASGSPVVETETLAWLRSLPAARGAPHGYVTLNGPLLRLTDELGITAGSMLAALELAEQKLRMGRRGVAYDWCLYHPSEPGLRELVALAGTQPPVIGPQRLRLYDWAHAMDAVKALGEAAAMRGKLVLTLAQS